MDEITREIHAESLYFDAQREIRPLMALVERSEEGEEYVEDFAIACTRSNVRLAKMAEQANELTPLGTALNSAAAAVACAAATAVTIVETKDGRSTSYILRDAVPETRELFGSVQWIMWDLWRLGELGRRGNPGAVERGRRPGGHPCVTPPRH